MNMAGGFSAWQKKQLNANAVIQEVSPFTSPRLSLSALHNVMDVRARC